MNTATTQAPTLQTLRGEYRAIRRRSVARTPEAFDARVREILTARGIDAPSPADFVKVARTATFRCDRCGGTGIFSRAWDVSEPGCPRPVGNSAGPCYRCDGKGVQDDSDARRNYGYDRHAFAEACRAMMGG